MNTLIDMLTPAYPVSTNSLFRLAEYASWLAKIAPQNLKGQLYKAKDAILVTLLTGSTESVDLRYDQDRHRGLLSIGLRERGARRLHTHENWLANGSSFRSRRDGGLAYHGSKIPDKRLTVL